MILLNLWINNMTNKVNISIQHLFIIMVNEEDCNVERNFDGIIENYNKDKLIEEANILLKILSNLKVENLPTPEDIVNQYIKLK